MLQLVSCKDRKEGEDWVLLSAVSSMWLIGFIFRDLLSSFFSLWIIFASFNFSLVFIGRLFDCAGENGGILKFLSEIIQRRTLCDSMRLWADWN